MDKRQLIDKIRLHNTSAQPQFLEVFDEAELARYLQRLEASQAKRAASLLVDDASLEAEPLRMVS